MEEIEKPLSDRENLFVISYLSHLQKDRAAKDAGYSGESAKQIGYEVYNRPHVKAYIEKVLKEGTISAVETIKLLSDTAIGNLNDHLKTVQVLRTKKVKKGLQELIQELKHQLLVEEEYCAEKGLTEKAYDKFQEGLEWYHNQILRYRIELRHDPNAYRFVDGPEELVDEVVLDLVSLSADKQRGKIKSIKYTKDGPHVELYSAQDAQKELGKIHGIYRADNEQQKNVIKITIQNDDALLGE